MTRLDIVGIKEIAERTQRPGETLKQAENRIGNYIRRDKTPAPEWIIGGRPAWRWKELVKRCPEIRNLLTE